MSSLISHFNKPLHQKILLSAVLISLLLPLALYAWIGFYSRYAADDYETAGALQTRGFWGSQDYWYQNWSGRYTYFFLIVVVESFGTGPVPFITAACLSLWFLGTALCLKLWSRRTALPWPRLLTLGGSALLLFVTLRSLQFIHQIIFWQTGVLTYVNYLIFFCFILALFTWRLQTASPGPITPLEGLLSALLAFIAAGLSEVTIATQITLCALGVIFYFFRRHDPRRQRALALLGVALAASLLGFAVMAAAPGNAIRARLLPPRPDLVSLFTHSLQNTFIYIFRWLGNYPELAALAVLLPLLAALFFAPTPAPARRQALQLALGGLIFTFLVLWANFITGYYAQSAEPPDRALVIPQFFLTAQVMAWGWAAGRALRLPLEKTLASHPKLKPWLAGGILLVLLTALAVGPLYGTVRIYSLLGPMQERAAAWDERDAFIRAAAARGEKTVTVQYLHDLNRLGDYGPDPEFLVNRAAADYYGLDAIIALEK
ncbi:MAG TPA: DUF6056 family protein [Anaerolineaceae bacterium]|nr:DUF6056 family protein [Anaerolineaceae bacterium]HPN51482.1 DUF6056 family protein [Anaerolineaceae bacterium]